MFAVFLLILLAASFESVCICLYTAPKMSEEMEQEIVGDVGQNLADEEQLFQSFDPLIIEYERNL